MCRRSLLLVFFFFFFLNVWDTFIEQELLALDFKTQARASFSRMRLSAGNGSIDVAQREVKAGGGSYAWLLCALA